MEKMLMECFFSSMVSVLQEITRNLIPQSSSNEVYKWKKLYVYFSKLELLFEVDFNDNWQNHHNAQKKTCSIIQMHMWICLFTPTTEFSEEKNDIQMKRKWSKKDKDKLLASDAKLFFCANGFF